MPKKVNKSSKAVGHECNRITEAPVRVQLHDSCAKNVKAAQECYGDQMEAFRRLFPNHGFVCII